MESAATWQTKEKAMEKFHIGIYPDSHEVIVAEVKELKVADCEIGLELIKKAPRSVKRVIGDGAYDTFECYKSAHEKNLKLLTPPRQGAVLNENDVPWVVLRNEAIAQIIGLGNDEETIRLWKKLSGYHRRSLVETSFSRFKGIFGGKLFSKTIDSQEVELLVKTRAMNEMTRTGMPKGMMICG